MATGVQEDTSAIDVSVMSGSEAVFEHVCQPCRDDEKIREAVGFCVDCADWLCDDCFRIHTRPRPWKHHVLRDMNEMKNHTSPPPKQADKCKEKCNKHSGKRLKYYCHVHDYLGCSLCVIQGHGTCKVDHIPDICENTDIKDEFQQVTKKLEAFVKVSSNLKNEVTENEGHIKTKTKETANTIRGYIKRLKDSLDEVGATLEEECKEHANGESTRLKNAARICEYIEKESLSMKTSLENLQNTGQHCNVFVALKQSKGILATLGSKQKDAKRSSSVTTLAFKPNATIETIITGPEGIGTLLEQNAIENRDYSNVKARHIADIPVKSSGNETCSIIGATLLSSDKLVLTDHENDQVKVVNTRTNTLISDYNVDGYIWDICKASDDSIAVTDYMNHRLLFLSVNVKGNISLLKTMTVNGKCKGVAMMDGKMIVTYVDPDKMEINDTRGTVLQTITDPQIVNRAKYVAASSDRQSVYVSNFGNHTVTNVKLDGTLIATYKDSELQGPEQIAIDSNGMVYVVGLSSNNVHLVTPDLKKVKVILDRSDCLESLTAVSYRKQTDRLYIGSGNCDFIKVFQLS